MMAPPYTLADMPELDLGIAGSTRATASRAAMDCRVEPGNDSTQLSAGFRRTGLER